MTSSTSSLYCVGLLLAVSALTAILIDLVKTRLEKERQTAKEIAFQATEFGKFIEAFRQRTVEAIERIMLENEKQRLVAVDKLSKLNRGRETKYLQGMARHRTSVEEIKALLDMLAPHQSRGFSRQSWKTTYRLYRLCSKRTSQVFQSGGIVHPNLIGKRTPRAQFTTNPNGDGESWVKKLFLESGQNNEFDFITLSEMGMPDRKIKVPKDSI